MPSPTDSAVPGKNDQEMAILTEIGQVLSSTLELREEFAKIMQILIDKLHMHRGSLVLLDDSSGRLRIEAAVGFTPEEIERGVYALGEGITGNVVATGRPRVIPDIRKEPDFLNRTYARKLEHLNTQVSFFCIPIKVAGRTAGALSCDKEFVSDEQLHADEIFLGIITAFLGQAIQINRMVMRQKEELLEENRQLRDQVRDRYRFENIIGDAPAMHEVFATVGQVANSRATVLLSGETGTGKEMIAKAIHYNSERHKLPFVAVNVAAIPRDLIESELFGHEKGAFTGADALRRGRFEQADGGTLFLDEIGDMSPALQTRLLRVLAEGEFYRVGGQTPVKVDVRVIAATHQDLEMRVKSGHFREDLLHRLNVIRIEIPPLRERREDIPELLRHYLSVAGQELGVEPKLLTGPAETALVTFDWPGNVRQLVNACRRLTVTAPGREVRAEDIPPDLGGVPVGHASNHDWMAKLSHWAEQELDAGTQRLLDTAVPEVERVLIRVALRKADGLKQDAAKLLGWGRNTLTRKMKELGMEELG